MQLVRAVLGDYVHLVGTEAVFCRVGLALDSEFLDSILRQNYGGSIQRRVRVDQAIQCVVIRGGPPAVDADCIAFPLAHLTLFPVRLNRAGANEKQTYEVAPVERQIIDLPLADQL